jgi:hypothetical protein
VIIVIITATEIINAHAIIVCSRGVAVTIPVTSADWIFPVIFSIIVPALDADTFEFCATLSVPLTFPAVLPVRGACGAIAIPHTIAVDNTVAIVTEIVTIVIITATILIDTHTRIVSSFGVFVTVAITTADWIYPAVAPIVVAKLDADAFTIALTVPFAAVLVASTLAVPVTIAVDNTVAIVVFVRALIAISIVAIVALVVAWVTTATTSVATGLVVHGTVALLLGAALGVSVLVKIAISFFSVFVAVVGLAFLVGCNILELVRSKELINKAADANMVSFGGVGNSHVAGDGSQKSKLHDGY